MKRVFIIALGLVVIGAILYGVRQSSTALTEEEKTYFLSLYRDTWEYLATFVDPATSMPYDSSARQPATSLSNVGLYLASTAVASRTKLISKEEGEKRVATCLQSLGKVETWRGIPRPWFLIRSLQPTHGDEFSYAPHLANLIGGLLIVKTTFPTLASAADSILLKMELKDLYEARNGWLKGGYHVKTKNFAIFQSWGHWYYKYFASETRLLSFYLIARKRVPKKHWFLLVRPLQKKEGETFFVSGQEEGGLFTQYLTGLFLDERKNEMGRSQRSYARYQMKHAAKIGAPVWGWSSAGAPNGRYLTHGELRDEIVAPVASVLASIYFPKEAYENLKKLEALGGRSPQFGFRDSLNWKTGEVSKNYLTANQAMAFLSLANLLSDGIVWKSFQEDPIVQAGLKILSE